MQEVSDWRKLLGKIIADPQERSRIVDELNITNITLGRWISGESVPRPQNLRRLVDILPLHREQLLELLRAEKGLSNYTAPREDTAPKDIPAEFYARVFSARAATVENLRFWSSCNLILQQALGQLDPDRRGLSIWVVRCMPPSGPYNKVRSLRETTGQGTNPWVANLEQKSCFLGAETLAGTVVTLCRPSIIEDLEEEHPLTIFLQDENEKSVAIYPILYAGKVAGVLIVSSSQINHFLSQSRTALIQKYADLIALAFEPEDFYNPEDIALSIMPTREEQREYFSHFRRMVNETLINSAANRKQPTSTATADLQVWRQLEEELLELSANKSTSQQ